uniref:UDP-N-acetylglucosamine 1-carboxyvinyltransferase n=1 Tax=Lygus hesperus TaxID=30085 RepID=A0A0A9XH74_LYGHE
MTKLNTVTHTIGYLNTQELCATLCVSDTNVTTTTRGKHFAKIIRENDIVDAFTMASETQLTLKVGPIDKVHLTGSGANVVMRSYECQPCHRTRYLYLLQYSQVDLRQQFHLTTAATNKHITIAV